MNKDYVEMELKMPIPMDKPDANGCIFDVEAVKEALKDTKNIPLVYYDDNDDNDRSVAIGMSTENLTVGDNCTEGNFTIWNKDYIELINTLKNNIINTDMSFNIVESHNDGDVVVVDKMNINSTSVNI